MYNPSQVIFPLWCEMFFFSTWISSSSSTMLKNFNFCVEWLRSLCLKPFDPYAGLFPTSSVVEATAWSPVSDLGRWGSLQFPPSPSRLCRLCVCGQGGGWSPFALGLPPVIDCHSLALGGRLGVPVKLLLSAIIIRKALYVCTAEGSLSIDCYHLMFSTRPSVWEGVSQLFCFVLRLQQAGALVPQKGLSILLPCHQSLCWAPSEGLC